MESFIKLTLFFSTIDYWELEFQIILKSDIHDKHLNIPYKGNGVVKTLVRYCWLDGKIKKLVELYLVFHSHLMYIILFRVVIVPFGPNLIKKTLPKKAYRIQRS